MPGTLAQILANKADLVDGKVKTDQLPAIVGGNGLSAYEVAVANGFMGTEPEWLLSLKGAQGERGLQGEQGIQGIQGLPGSDATVTKTAVEAVLTGEITSHTHPTSGGADPWVIVKLAQDFTTSLATNTNVTNFLFTPAPNKTYLIFGYFLLRTATATVGARTGVAWPSNLTDAVMRMEASNSLTAAGIRFWGARTTQNTGCTGLATTADSHWGSLDGIMITASNVSGNFQITLASETAGTNVTIKAGSILMYREL